MRKIFVFFGLVCFLGSVTGCGATNALFNSKLEKDSLLHQITLDHPTNAAKMNGAPGFRMGRLNG
jgi:hypothetical protein